MAGEEERLAAGSIILASALFQEDITATRNARPGVASMERLKKNNPKTVEMIADSANWRVLEQESSRIQKCGQLVIQQPKPIAAQLKS